MKKRRKLISGATRHDMSVGCVKYVSGHEFVYLSDGDSGKPWDSRCPMVTPIGPQFKVGEKPNAVEAWGVTVTAHQAKRSETINGARSMGGRRGRGREVAGLSLAPVCVVAVAGPVTVFHDWRQPRDTDEEELPKMERCRAYVASRGLVLHDVRPGIGMDVVLYDSWDRARAIGAI